MRHARGLILLLVLTACATPVVNQIAAAESGLQAVQPAIQAYFDQPWCGTPGVVICKTKAGITRVMQANQTALTSVLAADQAQSQEALAAAQTAVSALQQIITTLPH